MQGSTFGSTLSQQVTPERRVSIISHQSVVKTSIRDLGILDRALHTFGQGLRHSTADPEARRVIAMDGRAAACQAVVLPLVDGVPTWREPDGRQSERYGVSYREIGLQRQADGSYSFVGDLSYPRKVRFERVTDPWGYRQQVLLREYAVQTGLYLAEQQGMYVARLPVDCTSSNFAEYVHAAAAGKPSLAALIGQAKAGAAVLLLTGGYLPQGMTLVFTANADGTTSIALDGGVDNSCYLFTKPFQEALGAVLADTSHLEIAHAGPELLHISR